MAIYARRKASNFVPAPEGMHLAVCCDVWTPWTEERKEEYGGGLVDRTRICWLIEEINPKNQQPYEASQIYNLSLHPKSNMSKMLESWRGRAFTDEERKGFDLETVIGVSCQIQVAHNTSSEGTVYANVMAVVPLGKGMQKLSIPAAYVRKKDRPETTHGDEGPLPTEDSAPFGFVLPFLAAVSLLGGLIA